MSADRKARIASLEDEVKRLRVEETTERRAELQKKVEALCVNLPYEDLIIVEELVQAYRRGAWSSEHDDDE